MQAREYYAELLASVKNRPDITIEKYRLAYRAGNFEFLRLASKNILPDDRVVLIRAGIHGEEIAGPITIRRHAKEIFDYARRRGVKLIVYPLGNPSGFENNERYNCDGDSGEAGNNDFLRYELADGTWRDDLEDRTDFKTWRWSSDENLGVNLPLETKLAHKLLRDDLKYKLAAAIDLHQDYISPETPAAAYAYAYGDLSIYKNIAASIAALVPLYRNREIDAGFQAGAARSDNYGFVVRHDGSLTDLLCRLGVRHSITVETTGTTPLDIADQVNLIWIYGLIDLL